MSFDLRLVNGSFQLGPNGDFQLARNQEKLSQDVIKIIATAVGTNLAHKWYGSIIPDKIVGSGLRQDLLKAEIAKSITSAVENLKSLQEQQARAGQVLTPNEAILSLEAVQVLPSSDPRAVIIVITIKTRSGKILQEELSLSI
jgi:hypothetical protein